MIPLFNITCSVLLGTILSTGDNTQYCSVWLGTSALVLLHNYNITFQPISGKS